jgi:hypothetical protein
MADEQEIESVNEVPKRWTEKKKPAKKRKPQKRRAAPAAEAPQKVPAEFAGLNATECCNACNKESCVISGINVCSHPMKCGLQASQMGDMEVVKRYGRAKKALKNLMIDLRDG